MILTRCLLIIAALHSMLLSLHGQGNEWAWGGFPTVSVGAVASEKWSVNTFGFLMVQNVEGIDAGSSKHSEGLLLSYLETSVTRTFDDHWSGTLSYTKEQLWPASDSPRHEHRIWVQVNAVHPGNKPEVEHSHRMRWDQRYLIESDSNEPLVRPRIRYQWGRTQLLRDHLSVRTELEGFVEMHQAAPQRFMEAWGAAMLRRQLHPMLRLDAGIQCIAWRAETWTVYTLASLGLTLNLNTH